MYDVAIIGGGVIGTALAAECAKYQLRTVLVEKNNDVGDETTKANSAIIHAGYDPAPETLMGKLNVRGNALAKELCEKLNVPYKQIGSLVLAFDEADVKTVEKLYDRGVKNGVPGLTILSAQEVHEMEPNLSDEVKCALYAPSAGVIAPWEYAIALAENAYDNGCEFKMGQLVTEIRKNGPRDFTVITDKEEIPARYVINAAGVHSDEIHNMVSKPCFTIHPNKGEYYLLDKNQGGLVSRVIFQCPSKVGKGVLVSPTVHGNLIVGPNAVDVEEKSDTATTQDGLDFVAKVARRSMDLFSLRENIRTFAGVRANSDVDDFIIEEAKDAPGFIDAAGIKSPGLSCAPAIAEYIVELMKQSGLNLVKKEHHIDTREKIRFKELTEEEKKAVIAKDPRYGRVICRCETITEGEIVQALRHPLTPNTIDGIKRRCNAGMGRCQGGFCGPRVMEIICRERGVDPLTVQKDKEGSYIIIGETKNAR